MAFKVLTSFKALPAASGDTSIRSEPYGLVLLGDRVGAGLEGIWEVRIGHPDVLVISHSKSYVGLVAHWPTEVQTLIHPALREVEIDTKVLKKWTLCY